jgi:hypothetical protein
MEIRQIMVNLTVKSASPSEVCEPQRGLQAPARSASLSEVCEPQRGLRAPASYERPLYRTGRGPASPSEVCECFANSFPRPAGRFKVSFFLLILLNLVYEHQRAPARSASPSEVCEPQQGLRAPARSENPSEVYEPQRGLQAPARSASPSEICEPQRGLRAPARSASPSKL